MWRVARLSPSSAAESTFTLNSSSSSRRQQQQQQQGAEAPPLPDGAVVSVAAYFKAVYGLELAAPQLPCVDVGRKGGPPILYPLELCRYGGEGLLRQVGHCVNSRVLHVCGSDGR